MTMITRTYREEAVRSASSVEAVAMLYDMLIEDLRRIVAAMRARDIEQRVAETKHAFAVLEQLQGTLRLEEGGEAARNMDRLYAIARAKLLEAQMTNSPLALEKQVSIFIDLRQAWAQVTAPPQPEPALMAEAAVAEGNAISGHSWSA